MFGAALSLLLFFTFYHEASPKFQKECLLQFINSEFRAEVAKRATTWNVKVVVEQKSNSRPLDFFLGHQRPKKFGLPVRFINETIELPESFDARERWPDCPTIREIRQQGQCGSCWAFAAIEAMSDRICIHSNASVHARLSPRDVMTCCERCSEHSGCIGGNVGGAWRYWVDSGIVTGGDYASPEPGCRPYESDNCTSSYCEQISFDVIKSVACKRHCIDSYPRKYSEDLHFGESVYSIHPSEEQIMKEIFLNGPVSSAMSVHKDIKVYGSGVYQHVYGELCGGHVVKIIGWGVERGVPYWLVANSWGSVLFGDEMGFFKTLRGSNHMGIEEHVMGGIPKYNRNTK